MATRCSRCGRRGRRWVRRAERRTRASNELYQLLADIFSVEKADQRVRRRVEPLGDRFPVLELAGGHERDELAHGVGPELDVLGDDETAHGEAHGEERTRVVDGNGMALVA